MIKVIVAVVLALYFLFGFILFSVAIKEIGGRKSYLDVIYENHPEKRSVLAEHIVFFFIGAYVTVAWPYFLRK